MADDIDLAAPKTGTGDEGSLDEEPKGSNKIIFIMLPLLLLVAVGAGLYFSGTLDKFINKEQAEQTARK